MLQLLLLLIWIAVNKALVIDDYADGNWRKSLDGDGSCWTDKSCDRVLTNAHGGEWNVTFPYSSLPAFQQAYIDGADAIKGGKYRNLWLII